VRRRSGLAALLLVATAASAEAGFDQRIHALGVAAAALLFVVLPGVALAELLFRPGALDGVRRALLVPTLSISAAIVVGVALAESHVRLDRETWALALGSLTVAALAGAMLRTWTSPVAVPQAASRRWKPRSLAALAAGALLVCATVSAALVVATRPAGAEHVNGYTLLSLLPAAKTHALDLQVTSFELRPTRYRLVVRLNGQRVLLATALTLRTTQSWSGRVARPDRAGIVSADLERWGAGRYVSYRHAHVGIGPAASGAAR
jgi:uncharacterized membrane protein